jgi:hypothetical protein
MIDVLVSEMEMLRWLKNNVILYIKKKGSDDMSSGYCSFT